MASAAAALAFFSASPPCHGRGVGGVGVMSLWNPAASTPGCPTSIGSISGRTQPVPRSRRRPASWLAPPPPPPPPMTSMLGREERRPRAGKKTEQSSKRRRRRPFGDMLRRTSATRVPVPDTDAEAAVAQPSPTEGVAKHLGVVLLPPLGWFPAAVASMLKRRPVEYAAASAAAATEPVVAAAGRPAGISVLQWLARSEAVVAGAVLVAAPLLLRFWARAEAAHHDTLECRSVLQTFLIAGFGWVCAVLAAVAGNPVYAVKLQLAWRAAAARSLWTWSDLGRDLADTPGWLHASVARWRMAATRLALAGAAGRLLVLLAAAIGRGRSAVLALSSPALEFLPAWLVQASKAPLEGFELSSAQLGLGVGMYLWIGYYACCFLPYRVLYDEYQSYQRRVAQIVKDMYNGDDNAVVLSTKLGPQFPKHLTKRMAKMPPGDDREALRLMGIIRQRSCSYTVVKAAKPFKKRDGSLGIKMTPLEFGDMRHWGSDLFQRLEQQERHDKKTGWKRPDVPGSGPDKYNIAEYARIMRTIKVELGKTDFEMENDPALSVANLSRFDPDAEDGGDFNLVVQQERQSNIDAARDNYRMKNSHEMLVKAPTTPPPSPSSSSPSSDGPLREADAFSHEEELSVTDNIDDQGTVLRTDSVSYKSGDTAGAALEEAIRSRTASTPEEGAADRMTPATATRDTQDRR